MLRGQTNQGVSHDELSKFATDLIASARKSPFDPVVGREEQIERCIQILSRRSKNNPCIVGEPGVGKTGDQLIGFLCVTCVCAAIVQAMAQHFASMDYEGEVRELWSLDVAALVAGTSLRGALAEPFHLTLDPHHKGEFEERMQSVLTDAKRRGRNALLFIGELTHLERGTGVWRVVVL